MIRPRLVIFLLVVYSSMSSAAELVGIVGRILDGDTIGMLGTSGQQIRIRLADIDAPESGQVWGREAHEAIAEKVFRKKVTVKVLGADSYGRLLGRVWLGDRDINRELVTEGHAWVYRQFNSDETLIEVEVEAQKNRVGLWSESSRVPPWEWRTLATKVSSPAPIPNAKASGESYTCEAKKYCSQMANCGEAFYYLTTCGLANLDRDHDGVPCESLCR